MLLQTQMIDKAAKQIVCSLEEIKSHVLSLEREAKGIMAARTEKTEWSTGDCFECTLGRRRILKDTDTNEYFISDTVGHIVGGDRGNLDDFMKANYPDAAKIPWDEFAR